MTEPSEQANKMINHNLGVTWYQNVSVSMIGQLDGRRSPIGWLIFQDVSSHIKGEFPLRRFV